MGIIYGGAAGYESLYGVIRNRVLSALFQTVWRLYISLYETQSKAKAT